MQGVDAPPVAPLQHRMLRDQRTVLEDAQLARMGLHLQHAPAGGVRDAVEVAAHRDHAVLADPPLHGQHRAVGDGRMRQERGPLLGEVFGHHAAGGGMAAGVRYLLAPGIELAVEILQVPKAPRQEEVLADVAVRPLHLALRLRPVGAAGARDDAVVVSSATSEAL